VFMSYGEKSNDELLQVTVTEPIALPPLPPLRRKTTSHPPASALITAILRLLSNLRTLQSCAGLKIPSWLRFRQFYGFVEEDDPFDTFQFEDLLAWVERTQPRVNQDRVNLLYSKGLQDKIRSERGGEKGAAGLVPSRGGCG
jgi:hypothetical protein